MAESFERLSEKKIIPTELAQNLKKAVGFRNLSVHAYDKIDWHLVWNILEGDLKDLAFDFLYALKNLMFKSFKEKYIIFSYYTIPLHLQPVFKNLGHQSGEFPVAEKVANQCLSLPTGPYLGSQGLRFITNNF